MSAESDCIALLRAHAGLAALVADRIAQNATLADDEPPFVVLSARHDYTLNLLGQVIADAATLSIQCWARTATQATQVADQVAAALATAPVARGVAVTDRTTAFDSEVGLDGEQLTVEWWA